MTNSIPTFDVGSKSAALAGYRLVGADSVGRYVFAKSLTGGGITVTRTDANGKLDASFGTNGVFSRKFESLTQDAPRDVLINSDNSILVVSQAYHSSGTTNRYRLEVVKLTSQGSLDSGFGTGGLVNFETSSLGGNKIGGATLDASGRLLIAATHSISMSEGEGIAVIRLKPDGKLDTFGSGGVATANMSSSGEEPIDVGVLANGTILLAGMHHGSVTSNHVVKFSASGQRDTTFGSSGRAVVSFSISDLEVQSDGKFLLVGTGKNGTINQIQLARFDASGRLDLGFGSNGYILVNLSGHSQAVSVKEGQGGRIFVSGSNGGSWPNDSVVLAYHPDGRLDTSFGNQGLLHLSLGSGATVEVLPNGKLFLVGDKAIVRLLPDGAIDPTFEGATPVSTLNAVSQFVEGGPPVVLDGNVSIFDAELSNSGSYAGASLTLARMSAPSPDDLFSGAGIQSGSSNGDVIIAGVVIGQYAYLQGALKLEFNQLSTRELINQAMRELSYANANKHPPSSVQIVWTFNDGAGANGGVQSSLEVVGQTLTNITNVNDLPLGNVTIAGVLEQGQTLSASNNLTDVDGLGPINYQWRENGAEISGATGSTFTLTQAQVGKAISVIARYVDGYGTPEAVVSSSTGTVLNVNDPPIGVVTLSGTLEQGQTLNAAHNLSDVDGLGPISYQWRANGTAIEGATQSSFTLTADQVGMRINVTASYTDAMGTAESVSSAFTEDLVKAPEVPEVVKPAYEMGFVFSKTPVDTPGYISNDDLLYPHSLRLVSAGNIHLPSLTPNEVFFSAAVPGSFEANVLQGISEEKVRFVDVRLQLQADGSYSLTADNSFWWRLPSSSGSFLQSAELPSDAIGLWPLANINDWDQLLVPDPAAPEAVFHFRLDFDKPSIDPLLVVDVYTAVGRVSNVGLRFGSDVLVGATASRINLHEVLIDEGQVAVLFSVLKHIPNNQGWHDKVEKLYFATLEKASLYGSGTLTLATPMELAVRSVASWQADAVALGDGTYAVALGAAADGQNIEVIKVIPATSQVSTITQVVMPQAANLQPSYHHGGDGLSLAKRPDGRLSLVWSDDKYTVKGLLLDTATGAKTATSTWSEGVGYGYLDQAKVLPLSTGNMVAGWAQHSSLESLHGLYLVLINNQGVPAASPYKLTDTTPHNYALLPDKTGGMFVVWTEVSDYLPDTLSTYTTYARHFPLANEFQNSNLVVIGQDQDPVLDFDINSAGQLHFLSGGEIVQLDSLNDSAPPPTIIEGPPMTTFTTGVDLNGISNTDPGADYTTGPRSFWFDSNSQSFVKVQPNPFYAAQIGLTNGIQSIRIEASKTAAQLPPGAVLDWRFGWDGRDSLGASTTLAPRMPFGQGSQSPITFNFSHNNVNYQIEASLVARTGSPSIFDLNLRTANNSLMPNAAAQELLRQTGLSYTQSNPADHLARVDLTVKISQNGTNWTSASAGQAGVLTLELDSSAPVVFGAAYKGNQVEVFFKDPGAGTFIDSLPSATDTDWKLGQPNSSLFKVMVNGQPYSVTQAVMDSSVLLTLDREIPMGSAVTVEYMAPSADQITQVVQDWSGNDAKSFNGLNATYQARGMHVQIMPGAELGWNDRTELEDVYVSGKADGLTAAKVVSVIGDRVSVIVTGLVFDQNPAYVQGSTGFKSYPFSREWHEVELKVPAGSSYQVNDTIPFTDLVKPDTPFLFARWYIGAEVSNDGNTVAKKFEMWNFGPDQPISTSLAVFNSMEGMSWGQDNITGGPGPDYIRTGNDDDHIHVGGTNGGGNDTLDGGADGQFGDTVTYNGSNVGVVVNLTTGVATDGAGGTDTLINIEHINSTQFADNLTGNAKTNWFRPGAGNDTINGMEGRDVVMYEDATSGVTVNLQTGVASGTSIGNDTLTSIENLHATFFNDNITLSNSGSYVFARAGNDSIQGGTSSDHIIPGSGNDTIDGGDGWDNVSYRDDGHDSQGAPLSTLGVTVNLQTGTATDNWGNTDTLRNIESVDGSHYADTLTGNDQNNGFNGGGGNDTINGGAGVDSAGYSGNREDYSLVFTAANGATPAFWTVTDSVPGRDGTDRLTNIETLRFNNAVLNISNNGTIVSPTSYFRVDPAGSYLADVTGQGTPPTGGDSAAKGPTKVMLGSFNATAGQFITLSATGAWQSGSGNSPTTGLPFQDVNTSMVSVFVDANGNYIAPEAHLGHTTQVQFSGKNTNISQDFFVVSSGVTMVKVPTGAVALLFSVTDSFYGDNIDPNNDFGVQIKVADGINWQGNDLQMGSSQNDTLRGSDGNDSLSGGIGDDLLIGDLGSDVFWGGSGADTIEGGLQVRQPWIPSTSHDYDRIEAFSSANGMTLNLTNRTLTVDGETDVYSGIEEIIGANNKPDMVTGRTSESASVGDGNAIYLFLRGGSDVVNITGYGYQQPWADGAIVGYHWSKTPIQVTYSGGGLTASVSYGATADSSPQASGTDTLTHVGIIGDSNFNDTFDLRNAKFNQLGYITDPSAGVSYNTLLLGRGGSDTIMGNGQTNIHYGAVTNSNSGLGVNINLTNTGPQDLSHLSTRGINLGTVTFSGVRGVTGTQFDDTLIGGAFDKFESFRGDGGNDFIDGRTGYDRADYRFSTDGITVNMAQGIVTSASQGTDTLRSIEDIRGSMLNDVYDARGFVGGAASTDRNVSSFWWGQNSFMPEGGNDVIHGNGSTRIEYSNAMVAVEVDLKNGFADARLASDKTTPGYLTVGRDTFSGVSDVRGSAFDDVLLGGGAGRSSTGLPVEFFTGNAGNDTINGFEGWDVAVYANSPGAIQVSLPTASVQDGWGFTDTITGIEEFSGSQFGDTFLGNAGNQTFNGSNGADTMDGGSGYDEVGFSTDEAGVTVNLGAWVGSSGTMPSGFTGSARDGWGTIDVFRNIDGVEGSAFNDTITGDANDNRLDGRGGNDTITGGSGNDWVEYNQAMSGIHVDLSQNRAFSDGQGDGRTSSGTGVDTLSGIENVEGGYSNDQIIGDGVANQLDGGAGDDTLEGKAGNDTLWGGAGYDTARFSGNQNQYTVTFNAGPGTWTVADTVAGRDGTDTLYDIERLQFSDGEHIITDRPVDTTIRVDLNGDEVRGFADSEFSPFYYWKSNSPGIGHSRAQPNPFWQAQLEGENGIKSLKIAVDKTAAELAPISLDWRFGWHNTDQVTGEISSRTAKLIPFAGSFSTEIFNFGVDGQNINLRVSPIAETVNGKVLHGLLIEASDGRVLPAETMQSILRNVGVEYRSTATQGAADKAINLTVQASVDGVNFVGAKPGAAGTMLLEAEGIAPTLSVAYYSQNLISLQFAKGARPTEVVNMQDDWEAWLGNPPASMFSVTVNGSPVSISKVVMDEQVMLHLASPIAAGATVRVTYNDPAGDQVKNVIQRWHGLDAASFNNFTVQAYAGVRLEAGSGAVLGVGTDLDFTHGRYVSPETDIDIRVPAKIVATTADTFSIALVGQTLPNPSFVATASSGFRSFAFSTEGIVLELQKQGATSYTVGSAFDFWAAFSNTSSTQLMLKSMSHSVFASQQANGANPVEFALGKSSPMSGGFMPLTSFLLTDELWGNDSITGSAFNDSLLGSTGNDTIIAGAGADTVVGGSGNDQLDGGIVTDRINFSDLNVVSYRGAPAAVNIDLRGITGDGSSGQGTVLDGYGGTDTVRNFNFIVGSKFADTINGSAAAIFEQFEGGLGNDTIDGGAISDQYSNASHNRVSYTGAPSGVNVNLATGLATGGDGNDTLINISSVRGSLFADIQTGSNTTSYTESFEGRAGDDTIDGAGGNDFARYDWAAAPVWVDLSQNAALDDGDGGSDVLINIEGVFGSAFNDVLKGGNLGNDRFEFFRGNAGNDTIDGGSGFDRVDYTSSTSGVNVTLGGYGKGTAQDGLGGTDELISIEAVRGSAFNDVLRASGRSTFATDGYSEVLEGLEGNDHLHGTPGASTVASYGFSPVGVTVNLATGQATNDGFGSVDTLTNIEAIRGSNFGDTLLGNGLANRFFAQDGNDTITGAGGDDHIDGGLGVDTARFTGNQAQYTLTADPSGMVSVVDNTAARDGRDNLFSVEKLQFADGVIDAPVYTPPGGSGLQGMVYHWKSHMLMSGTNIQISDNKAVVATPSDVFDLRGVVFNSATGKMTVDVWVNPTTGVGNFDFSVGSASASGIKFTESLSSEWTILRNPESEGSLLVSGYSLTSINASVKLGTLELTLPAGSTSISVGFNDIVIGEQLISPQSLNLAGQVTGTDGKYAFASVASGTNNLTVSRLTTDSGSAINSADALAALKIAVNINPNSSLKVSPYQIIAADANKDGRVNSLDALEILKMAVKLSTALPQEWLFANEKTMLWNTTTNSSALTRTAAQWDSNIQGVSPTTNVVAILKGDVNGSWNAPAGSIDLDVLSPTYIPNLATLMGVPVDQWGGL